MSFLLSGKTGVSKGLREFRSKFGLSQAETAFICGVSLRTWQNLELQSVVPTGRTLTKIDAAMKAFIKRYGKAAKNAK